MDAPKAQFKPVATREWRRPWPAMLKAQGSATAATAMNTAARPIMLCMKATSSGILVISTRLAMIGAAVAADHQAAEHPGHACQCRLTELQRA